MIKILRCLCFLLPFFSRAEQLFSPPTYQFPHHQSKISTVSAGFENVFKDAGIRGLGLEQAVLDTESYHLFSHGRSAALLIGGKWLETPEIVAFLKTQTNIASFRHLNIYGCEFGQGSAGKAAVASVARALGMTVSASDGLTGKDGDWDLEVGVFNSVKGLDGFTGNLQCAGEVGGTGPDDDLDGDGICNDLDIDDDNDGVPDAVESPECFYTVSEAKVITSVTTELNTTGAYVIGNSYDGNVGTQSAFANGQNWVDKSIFEITPTRPLAITSVNFDVGGWNLSTDASSTFKLQGWDGTDWVDLSAPMYSIDLVDFSINNTLEPGVSYAKYRIVGVAGTCFFAAILEITLSPDDNFVSSAHPKEGCTNDTDNDTFLNHQDTDSDDDGCPDLLEAGVGSPADLLLPDMSTLDPNGTDANNDGLNDSVDPDLDGHVNYELTYRLYALSTFIRSCADTDDDGISDLEDFDDDNDGILDTDECPDCYFTESEARSVVSVTTELTLNTGSDIAFSYDGNTGTQSSFTNAQNWVGKSIFEITPGTLIAISSVNFDVGSWALSFDASSTFKLQGWAGTTWVDLSAPMSNTTTSDFTIANTVNPTTKYEKYRLTGVAGTSSFGGMFEISLTASPFVPSLHPRSTCSADADEDGIVNSLDLDSDGDGCPDAVESDGGFTVDDLTASDIPGGNSGGDYSGVAFGVRHNLGNTVDENGVPVAADGGNATGQSQVAGTECDEIDPCTVEIGGTVYNDTDGEDNGVNGTVVDGISTGLYVSLVNAGVIQDVAEVLADGTYTFSDVPAGTYSLVLSDSPDGSETPEIPVGGMAVAEGGDIDDDSGNSLGDGSPDGSTEITVACPQADAYTHVDFGVMGGPFPVKLISFNAQATGEGIKLIWQTTDEKGFDRFEIEHSASPRNGFNRIGMVKGGSSDYTYTDAAVRSGTAYYRLKMIDSDGSYLYSNILSVNGKGTTGSGHVFPNPTGGRVIRIASTGPVSAYKILDASGREIRATLSSRDGHYELSLPGNATPGLYHIIYESGGKTINARFILND